MTISPSELVIDAIQITTLPEVFQRVNEMTADDHYSASDIGHVVSQDPALSARILKVVNSPFYGFPSRIDTISRAITIVGERELRDIVLATSVTRVFKGLPADLINMETFWRHSVYCAVIAKLLALKLGENNAERFFLSGLMHDIGSLLIYLKIPDLAREAMLLAENEQIEIYHAERQVIGFDHAEAGAELLRAWKLPSSMTDAIEFHHIPENARRDIRTAAIIGLADLAANNTKMGQNTNSQHEEIPENLWQLSGVKPELLDSLMGEAEEQFHGAAHLVNLE